MAKAAIISKPQKRELRTILTELESWLAPHGFECILDPDRANYLDRPNDAVERRDMPELGPDIVISLGGDGTLLSAARAFSSVLVFQRLEERLLAVLVLIDGHRGVQQISVGLEANLAGHPRIIGRWHHRENF